MGKEVYENKCIKDLLSRINDLLNIQDSKVDERWKESPDFLISSNKGYLGIEHFVIDLFTEDIDGIKRSGSRLTCQKMETVYTNNNKKLIDNEFDTMQAKNEIEESINFYYKLLTQFDYTMFINNTRKIINKHLEKVDKYKTNLNKELKINTPIYFCIEIRVAIINEKSNIYNCKLKRKDGAIVTSCIRQVPFTTDMYDILVKAIGIVSGVFFVSYALDDFYEQTPLDIIYINVKDENAIKKSLIKQNIKVYQSFDFNIPLQKIKLNIITK